MDRFFSRKMKLSDLVEYNHNLILMLPCMGISLGFGDKSVEDVCAMYDIPVDFFLLVSNVYTFDDFVIDRNTIEQTDMRCLISYLLAAHRLYLVDRIPHIEMHLHHIADRVEEKYGNILKKFFDEYKTEVNNHFEYEEKQVFPYLKKLQEGESDNSYRISSFVHVHSNIEDKLDDLKQIIYKYLPGNILPQESIELVFDILRLSSDLQKHAIIEDRVLIPYVEILEKRVK
ncbi:MAG: hemerythrin domain-containing protein [Bacteroidales bacterium]|nr:hemerythrin domain-containing protein [Bacteroidales bacterium]